MHQDELERRRRAAIWLRRRPQDETSLTKLGGLPALPADIAWPRQLQSNTPLHFLAQVDLSCLPQTPLEDAPASPVLPKAGMLFFFADMVEEMLWNDNGGPFANTRVVFAKRAGPERNPPDDIPEILHSFGEHAEGYESGIVVYPRVSLEPHRIDTFGGVEPFPDRDDTYAAAAQAALTESIGRAIGPLPVFSGPGAWRDIKAANPSEYVQEIHSPDGRVRRELNCPLHQMLGVGSNIQGQAEQAAEEGSILLLQIDSDLSLHEYFMFCDMGMAQFWIRPDDLAERRFDRVWGTTEGG